MSTYRSPGVFTSEASLPVTVGSTAESRVLALVGDSQRTRSAIESVTLNGTTAVALSNPNVVTGSIVVTNSLSSVPYTVVTDYVVTTVTTITSIASAGVSGAIEDGEVVTVSYEYSPADYFNVKKFTDYDDISTQYGDPFDKSGAINSELSLAANIAFLNGATEIYCVAVDAVGDTPTSEEFGTAIAKLEPFVDVAIVVPVSGDQAVHALVKSHVDSQYADQVRSIAVVGADGTGALISSAAMITQAISLDSERVVLVSPSTIHFYNPALSTEMVLGGQYIAVGAASILVAGDTQDGLTRKTLKGFSSVNERRTVSERKAEAVAGLSLFDDRLGYTICYHGLTTSSSSDIEDKEISLVRSRYYMEMLLEETLDTNLIGDPIDSSTPIRAKGITTDVLERLMSGGTIANYRDVSARQNTSSPTTIDVKYSYLPAYPTNYVDVQFSVDTDDSSYTYATA